MALSKEQNLANKLNTLSLCNLQHAATAEQWANLVTTYFDEDDDSADSRNSSDDESDDEFVTGCNFIETDVNLDNIGDDDVDEVMAQGQGLVVINEAADALQTVQKIVICEDRDEEMDKIRNYSCQRCKINSGQPCYPLLDKDFVYTLRMQMASLCDFEKDLILLGKISCNFNNDATTHCSKKKTQKERQRQRTGYSVNGIHLCRETFKFIHCISQNKLTAILKHYKECGLTPRYKKSGGRRASDARLLTHSDITRVVSFIVNFAEDHALVLPGRVPGFKRFDIKLLPSNYTKASVFRIYKSAMEQTGERAVKIHSFRNLWRTLVPFIVRTRPMTDLCWVCQRNNSAVYRSANMADEEKTARIKAQELHLKKVTLERSLYQKMVHCAKSTLVDSEIKLSPNLPASRDIVMHYSFDYAQQVHYPSDPMQPGPMYFLVPRKCGLFGVTCEGLPQQVNYLIDEGMCISKGSNAVISFLDHFFMTYGLGEKHVQLHCDNCSGQNKNNMMLWYLLWRVLHGQHISITLNFLITGHTKFAPDWCFGLVKQRYRKCMVSCLDDIVSVVKTSTNTGVNIAQKVGSESGEIFVKQRDWQTYLKPFFKTLTGIKKYQHFRFDVQYPGCVFKKEFSDSEEEMVCLFKDVTHTPPACRPAMVLPPGLDTNRQNYLYKNIREFCTPASMDITCPVTVTPHDEDDNRANKRARVEVEM